MDGTDLHLIVSFVVSDGFDFDFWWQIRIQINWAQVVFEHLGEILRCLISLDEAIMSNQQIAERWASFKR